MRNGQYQKAFEKEVREGDRLVVSESPRLEVTVKRIVPAGGPRGKIGWIELATPDGKEQGRESGRLCRTGSRGDSSDRSDAEHGRPCFSRLDKQAVVGRVVEAGDPGGGLATGAEAVLYRAGCGQRSKPSRDSSAHSRR